jgi:hypothetical protein
MIAYHGRFPTINVENANDLYEALDLLHTQVMDNFPEPDEAAAYLALLERALDRVDELRTPDFA